MRYERMLEGKFLARPNRFIAEVEIDGNIEICHVKNTGRCKELLIPGVRVLVQKAENPERKTLYDLISVWKNGRLINMDSQAPNQVFLEWVKEEKYFQHISLLKPECKYKNSRFDVYLEADGKKHFVEVKGVTLEEDGVLMFPDAPTQRGAKHIKELIDAVSEGYGGHIFFVAQMEACKYFTPNRKTHQEFAEVLKEAKEKGVSVQCVNCRVAEDELKILDFVDVVL